MSFSLLILIRKRNMRLSLLILVLFCPMAYIFSLIDTIFTMDINIYINYPNVKFVKISGKIQHVPKENLVEYVRLNLSFEPSKYEYVKIFESGSVNGSIVAYNITNEEIANYMNIGCWNFSASYLWLRNMYCNGRASFCCQNCTFIKLDHSRVSYIRKPEKGAVIGVFENIVAVTHSHIFIFGHFISDVLIPLLIFPKEIISRSYVILEAKGIRHSHYLKYIDISLDQVIFLPRKQWIYTSNLYTPVDPFVHISHYGKLGRTFSQKIRNYFNLSNVIPNKYYLTNRPVNRTRHISNMLEICDIFKIRYPERDFTFLPDFNNFDDAAHNWGVAKIILGPTGSNLFKHYIMPKKQCTSYNYSIFSGYKFRYWTWFAWRILFIFYNSNNAMV